MRKWVRCCRKWIMEHEGMEEWRGLAVKVLLKHSDGDK